jgi:hypothetical protein
MHDIGARRTLGETALWLVGAFSLPALLVARLEHKDIAPFLFFMTSLIGHIPLLERYKRMTRVLPVPWRDGVTGYGRPPRKVRFNARAVFRLPPTAMLSFGLPTAVVVFAANILESPLVLIAGVILVWVSIFLLFARRFVRQYNLMRFRDSTTAQIDQRYSQSRHPQTARLQFTFQANGKTYSGEGWDTGYYVRVGMVVPIFFDAKNPTKNLLASESYFEVVDETNDK